MERSVNAMNGAYDGITAAVAAFIHARGASDGQRTPESDAALQSFKDRIELFKAACDRAEDIVLSAHRSLAGEFYTTNYQHHHHHNNSKCCSAATPVNAAGPTSAAATPVSPEHASNAGQPSEDAAE